MRNSKFKVEDFNPSKWFKVTFSSRKIVNDEQEVHVCYTAGQSIKEVTSQMKDSAGIGWISEVKEVTYDQIVRQIERALENEYR